MSMIYFAYGSNMLSARLGARCPSALVAGTGILDGWTLGFAKLGGDGSGKGTVTKGSGSVPGVLFHLSVADGALLDRVEGPGYARAEVSIRTTDGPCAAFTYVGHAPADGLVPFDWYIDLIHAGRAEHGLPALAPVSCRPDTDLARPGRLAALAALGAR